MFKHTLASLQDASYHAVDEMPGRQWFLIGCITHPLHVSQWSNPAPFAPIPPLTGVREHHILPHGGGGQDRLEGCRKMSAATHLICGLGGV